MMLPADYHLQLVTDHQFSSLDKLPELITDVVKGGVNVVQLRDKKANKKNLYHTGLILKALLSPLNIPFIVNDHIDVALAINADGIHIGQNDLPYHEARKIIGDDKIVGLTINTIEEAKAMGNCGADYFGVSPIFLTQTKPGPEKSLGFDGLKNICQYLKAPAISIGGLQIKDVSHVLKAGAQGIAVVSAILGTCSPEIAASQFVAALREAR